LLTSCWQSRPTRRPEPPSSALKNTPQHLLHKKKTKREDIQNSTQRVAVHPKQTSCPGKSCG
jgi:hypothetical protein